MKLSEELRNKKSRDNRDLLDRAANKIDELEAENKALTQILVNLANEEIRVMTCVLNAISKSEDKKDENN